MVWLRVKIGATSNLASQRAEIWGPVTPSTIPSPRSVPLQRLFAASTPPHHQHADARKERRNDRDIHKLQRIARLGVHLADQAWHGLRADLAERRVLHQPLDAGDEKMHAELGQTLPVPNLGHRLKEVAAADDQ